MTEKAMVKSPMVQDGEITKYRILNKDTKELIGNITQVVNRISQDGSDCYKIEVINEAKEGNTIEEIIVLQIGDTLKTLSYGTTQKNKNGKVIVEAQMECGDLELPLNSAHVSVVGFCLRGAPFGSKAKVSFNALTSEGTHLGMNGGLSSKKEKVVVPAGEFQCYSIGLKPDITTIMDATGVKGIPGMGALARQFTSSFHHWFSVDAPHYLIKDECFIVDPLQGKLVIIELTGIEHK